MRYTTASLVLSIGAALSACWGVPLVDADDGPLEQGEAEANADDAGDTDTYARPVGGRTRFLFYLDSCLDA